MCFQIWSGSPHHATHNAHRISLPRSSLFEPRQPSSIFKPSTKMENIKMVKVVAQTPIWNAWMVPLQVRRRKPCDDFSLLSLVRFTKLRKKCCAKLNTWIWTNTLHGIWWTGAWAPQPNVRFIPHRQYTSPKNGRRRVVTCLWSSPKWTQDLTHQRSRVSREQHVPDSSAFAVPDQASCSTPSTLREIFGRQTDTDADTDTDTDAKRRQQDKITNNKQRLNLTHVTHILGSVVLVSRWFEGDQACCQKRPGYVPKLYMTFEKVRREVSFETLIPPWLARSAKWPQKRSCLGRRGDGVSGRREEGVVVVGGKRSGVCGWVVWGGGRGRGERDFEGLFGGRGGPSGMST